MAKRKRKATSASYNNISRVLFTFLLLFHIKCSMRVLYRDAGAESGEKVAREKIL